MGAESASRMPPSLRPLKLRVRHLSVDREDRTFVQRASRMGTREAVQVETVLWGHVGAEAFILFVAPAAIV